MNVKLIQHLAELNRGAKWTFNLSVVETEDGKRTLYLGKWYGEINKHHSGILTAKQAEILYNALGELLNKPE